VKVVREAAIIGLNMETTIDLLREWSFPSTRYQGSKRKLIPWIHSHVRNLSFRSALDIFGGTGVVSYLFKRMGKCVQYNDYLKSNYYIGKALIENSTVKLTEADAEYLLSFRESPSRAFVSNTFRGKYYTDAENLWIDCVMASIGRLNEIYSGQVLQYKVALAYYALFQSCLVKRPFNLFHRNNLYLRTNEVARSFGNKTTWDKPFEELFKKFVDEINGLVFSNGESNTATNRDGFLLDGVTCDLVYIDPPYFSKGRPLVECDYGRMYHFLEGLASYNIWDDLIDYGSLNLHFKDNGYRWPEKNSILDRFDRLLDKLPRSIVVLSYKSPGIPKEEELISLVRNHKRNVQVNRLPYQYALRKPAREKGQNFELLIIGQ
jgi:adenine-specific DNA methylase